MTKIRDKDRRGNRMGKFNGTKTIGLEELRGYVFAHGDHGAGSKFNKTVEKVAEYCRVEVSKEIYQLVLYGVMVPRSALLRWVAWPECMPKAE